MKKLTACPTPDQDHSFGSASAPMSALGPTRSGAQPDVAMTRVGHGAGLRTVPPRRPLRLFSYAAKGELAASFAELNVPPHRCC